MYDYGGYFKYAVEYYNKGNYKSALDYINYALKYSPQNKDFVEFKNLVLRCLNGDSTAIGYYNSSDNYNDDESDYYFNLAQEKFNSGDFKGAIETVNKCISIDPQDSYAIALHGRCYEQMGMLEMALQDFNEAILIDASNISFYVDRAHLYFKKVLATHKLQDIALLYHDCCLCLELLDKEKNSNSTNPPPLSLTLLMLDYRATCHLYFNDPSLALEDANRVLELNKLHPDMNVMVAAYINRAKSYRLLNMPKITIMKECILAAICFPNDESLLDKCEIESETEKAEIKEMAHIIMGACYAEMLDYNNIFDEISNSTMDYQSFKDYLNKLKEKLDNDEGYKAFSLAEKYFNDDKNIEMALKFVDTAIQISPNNFWYLDAKQLYLETYPEYQNYSVNDIQNNNSENIANVHTPTPKTGRRVDL